MGWQAGDLALCVADRLPPPRCTKRTKRLRIGRVYTVISVRWSVVEQCQALGLAEAKSRGRLGDWHAQVFRKVTPGAKIEGFEEPRRVPVKQDA